MTDEEILARNVFACCIHCEHDDGYVHEGACLAGCNDDD